MTNAGVDQVANHLLALYWISNFVDQINAEVLRQRNLWLYDGLRLLFWLVLLLLVQLSGLVLVLSVRYSLACLLNWFSSDSSMFLVLLVFSLLEVLWLSEQHVPKVVNLPHKLLFG